MPTRRAVAPTRHRPGGDPAVSGGDTGRGPGRPDHSSLGPLMVVRRRAALHGGLGVAVAGEALDVEVDGERVARLVAGRVRVALGQRRLLAQRLRQRRVRQRAARVQPLPERVHHADLRAQHRTCTRRSRAARAPAATMASERPNPSAGRFHATRAAARSHRLAVELSVTYFLFSEDELPLYVVRCQLYDVSEHRASNCAIQNFRYQRYVRARRA
ncbi:uncharacterized protein LOC128199496 [Bicyclus anynana]|uniref:Uncharacterized protein LOC128199496 n=1 Tax=Bicyclus anynana TaxID=110368 RepID=A0ABM3M1N7_BICAN|nr:uncharacterized protein LOC128199496 [Bicyclus anynana]